MNIKELNAKNAAVANDYQHALSIVTADVDTVILMPADLRRFRKYLHTIAATNKKRFATWRQGPNLVIKRTSYYQK